MSAVHIQPVTDDAGELVDLIYYHHEHAPADVPGWTTWPESIDYPVHCGDGRADLADPRAGCGERVYEVPLTRYGQAEYGED